MFLQRAVDAALLLCHSCSSATPRYARSARRISADTLRSFARADSVSCWNNDSGRCALVVTCAAGPAFGQLVVDIHAPSEWGWRLGTTKKIVHGGDSAHNVPISLA